MGNAPGSGGDSRIEDELRTHGEFRLRAVSYLGLAVLRRGQAERRRVFGGGTLWMRILHLLANEKVGEW